MAIVSMVMTSACPDDSFSQLLGPILLFFGGPVLGELLAGGEGLGGVCKSGPCDGDHTFVGFVGGCNDEGGLVVCEGGLGSVRKSRPCDSGHALINCIGSDDGC